MSRHVALATVLVLAAACAAGASPARLVEVPRPTQEPTVEPEPTATEEETEEPEPTEVPEVVAPLTGAPVEDLALLQTPAVGVKIDNAPRARPQQGIEDADVVFEELVEGGLTRFLAVFHSQDVGTVGPVRSGRDVDAELFPPFEGILAISGAAPPTYPVLTGAGLAWFEETQAGGAIHRAPGRPAPHNVVAEVPALRTAAVRTAPPQQWPFASEAPAGGTPTADAVLQFTVGGRDDVEASWVWREDRHIWERGQEGTRHRALSGEQIGSENVVIARVEVGSGGGVDVSGVATVSIDLEGEGPAVVLRDGQRYDARWRNPGRDAPFEWLGVDGAPLPLAPGRTWVELLPVGGSVAFDQGGTSADAVEETETSAVVPPG